MTTPEVDPVMALLMEDAQSGLLERVQPWNRAKLIELAVYPDQSLSDEIRVLRYHFWRLVAQPMTPEKAEALAAQYASLLSGERAKD